MTASGKGKEAGRIFVLIDGDNNPLSKVLDNTAKQLDAVGKSFQKQGAGFLKAGAVVTAPMAGAVAHYLSAGDAMAKMADRTGLSVEALSTLKYAAARSGSSIELLEAGMLKMNQVLSKAEDGGKAAAKGLAMVGLTSADLDGLDSEQRLQRLADALAATTDPAKRSVAAMTLFGASAGPKLLPLLNSGAAGIGELQAKARRLGLEMKSLDAANAARLGDTFADITDSLKAAAFSVGAALAPALQEIADHVVTVASATARWIDRNRALVAIVGGVGAALAGIGAVLVGTGLVISTIAGALGALAGLFGLLASGIGLVLSPCALLVGGLVALATRFVDFKKEGLAAVNWIKTAFGELRDFVGPILDGIGQAVAMSDWGAAADVAMGGVKVAVGKGLLIVKENWFKVTEGIRGVWDDFVTWISSSLRSAMLAALREMASLAQKMKGFLPKDSFMARTARVMEILDKPGVGGKSTLDKLVVGADRQRENEVATAAAGRKAGHEADMDTARELLAGESRTLTELLASLGKRHQEFERENAAARIDQKMVTAAGKAENIGTGSVGAFGAAAFNALASGFGQDDGRQVQRDQLNVLRDISRFTRKTSEAAGRPRFS